MPEVIGRIDRRQRVKLSSSMWIPRIDPDHKAKSWYPLPHMALEEHSEPDQPDQEKHRTQNLYDTSGTFWKRLNKTKREYAVSVKKKDTSPSQDVELELTQPTQYLSETVTYDRSNDEKNVTYYKG